jgi:hypothetical protein
MVHSISWNPPLCGLLIFTKKNKNKSRDSLIQFGFAVATFVCILPQTAFLRATLDEEIYMDLPPGLEEINANLRALGLNKADMPASGEVILLRRSIYGLKQGARRWYKTVIQALKEMGFARSKSDECVFKRGECYIAVYVNDLMIVVTQEESDEVKAGLERHFELTDSGTMEFMVGWNVIKQPEGEMILQTQYIKNILARFGMENCKDISTPVHNNLYVKAVGPRTQEDYRGIIGALLYLAGSTRPDIAFSVRVLARYQEVSTDEHWKRAKRVLRYLQSTMEYGLSMPLLPSGEDLILKGWSDADFAGDPIDWHSTSRYVFTFGDTLSVILWQSRKQRIVALSTTKAEYIALAEAVQEAIYLRQVLEELGYAQQEPTIIFEDNQSAIAIVKNDAFRTNEAHGSSIPFHLRCSHQRGGGNRVRPNRETDGRHSYEAAKQSHL